MLFNAVDTDAKVNETGVIPVREKQAKKKKKRGALSVIISVILCVAMMLSLTLSVAITLARVVLNGDVIGDVIEKLDIGSVVSSVISSATSSISLPSGESIADGLKSMLSEQPGLEDVEITDEKIAEIFESPAVKEFISEKMTDIAAAVAGGSAEDIVSKEEIIDFVSENEDELLDTLKGIGVDVDDIDDIGDIGDIDDVDDIIGDIPGLDGADTSDTSAETGNVMPATPPQGGGSGSFDYGKMASDLEKYLGGSGLSFDSIENMIQNGSGELEELKQISDYIALARKVLSPEAAAAAWAVTAVIALVLVLCNLHHVTDALVYIGIPFTLVGGIVTAAFSIADKILPQAAGDIITVGKGVSISIDTGAMARTVFDAVKDGAGTVGITVLVIGAAMLIVKIAVMIVKRVRG